MKINEIVDEYYEKVLAIRKAKGQKGMVLTHNKKTGKLIKFRILYTRSVFDVHL